MIMVLAAMPPGQTERNGHAQPGAEAGSAKARTPEPPAATVNGAVTRQRGDAARRKAVSG
jgi:hypothetical protein